MVIDLSSALQTILAGLVGPNKKRRGTATLTLTLPFEFLVLVKDVETKLVDWNTEFSVE